MKTDPNHESPDVIDQRTRGNVLPTDPIVLPGITLPTTLPAGWTIDADGAEVPLPAPVPLTIPEITIAATPAPAASSSSSTGALVLLGLFAAGWALVRWARGS